MRHILEKAIVHILNGEQEKAEALFHKFMVEKARKIHELLRQGEDIELNENWDSEIKEEEYFDSDDLDDAGDDAVADVGDPAAASPVDGDEGAGAVDAGAEMPDVMDDAGGDDEFADDDAAPEAGGDMEGKIDDIESKIDELTAEFDRLMAKMDDGGDDDMSDDMDGDMDDMGDGDSLDDMGGDDMGGDEATDDVTDMGMGGEEPTDIADRMEDDMGDDDQPEHEMAEEDVPEVDGDDEMLEDITESVLAELDKIAVPSMEGEGKEVGSGGKKISPHNSSMLPSHDVDQRWQQAKPVMVKAEGDAHNDSFERETPPATRDIEARRNNRAGVKKLKDVPKDGDGSALINKDFTAKPSTQSIIDGKSKKG